MRVESQRETGPLMVRDDGGDVVLLSVRAEFKGNWQDVSLIIRQRTLSQIIGLVSDQLSHISEIAKRQAKKSVEGQKFGNTEQFQTAQSMPAHARFPALTSFDAGRRQLNQRLQKIGDRPRTSDSNPRLLPRFMSFPVEPGIQQVNPP